MKPDDTDAATSEIRQQIKGLEAELEAVLEDRRKTEAAIEKSRKQTQELLERSSEIAVTEGTLRKQIAELQSALEGLER